MRIIRKGTFAVPMLYAAAAQNASQPISANNWTKVLLSRTMFSAGEALANGTFTCPSAGLYLISVGVVFLGSSGVGVYSVVRRNGAEALKVGENGIVTSSIALTASGVLQLVAGDALEVSVYSTSGTQIYGNNVDNATTFSVVRLSGS